MITLTVNDFNYSHFHGAHFGHETMRRFSCVINTIISKERVSLREKRKAFQRKRLFRLCFGMVRYYFFKKKIDLSQESVVRSLSRLSGREV